MTDLSGAADEFRDLARNLRLVGEEDLRKELYTAISGAAKPLAREIKDPARLRDYMPARYADVLAGDLSVTTHKRTGRDPGVTIMARAPTAATGGRGGRKIRQRNEGLITHPLFGNTKRWWVQTKGMRAGFFDVPAERAAPRIRDAILDAMERVANKATGRP